MVFGAFKQNAPVQYLKGVGPKKAEVLSKIGITTVADLLFHLPVRYEDRSRIKKIEEIEEGRVETIIAEVREASIKFGRRRMFEVAFGDETGVIRAMWFSFNQKSYLARFKTGTKWIVTGKVTVNKYRGAKQIIHPETSAAEKEEVSESTPEGKIVAFYPLTEGITQLSLRGAMEHALPYIRELVDFTPDELNERYKLPTLKDSVSYIHAPPKGADLFQLTEFKSRPHKKLIFNEFLLTQIALGLKRRSDRQKSAGEPYAVDDDLMEKIYSAFPFTMTSAQLKAIGEIATDLSSGHPMNRLLQGDVGSGKTAVALAACLIAVRNKKQAAIMAPTEILAVQHWRNIKKALEKTKVNVALLTAGSAGRVSTLSDIASGAAHIVVGTHALIQEKVSFHDLGLAVIDEQHRFGVRQRAELINQGHTVHALIMTATPIPRTLAMTVYGDLDVSVIDELPPGRTPVKTRIYRDKERGSAFQKIREEVAKGRQAYLVYPLVEESEKLELKAATTMFESFKEDDLKDLNLGLLHGRMKSQEKEAVMAKFVAGDIDVLVSTTVIEVGVDVANASIMLIEHAERFGLSQLHQLRGRVGRSGFKSSCLLMADTGPGSPGWARLAVMEKYQDGFRIAEEDLNIRGSGDFFGARQSGLAAFKLGDIIRDHAILTEARNAAFNIIENDPKLEKPENYALKEAIKENWTGRFALGDIG